MADWIKKAGIIPVSSGSGLLAAEAPPVYRSFKTLRKLLGQMPPLMTSGLWPAQIRAMADFNIGLGETEAIAIAVSDKNNVLATDDRNAIRPCKILKIDYVTSILIRAFEKDLLEKEKALIKLRNLQLFGRFKKEIIESATKQISGEA